MKIKVKQTMRNKRLLIRYTFLFGVLLSLLAAIFGTEKTISVFLLSIGTSITASAIVSGLNENYRETEDLFNSMVNEWGIERIFATRAEINKYTNELLHITNDLTVCAMGLKGFRDAQESNIEDRVSRGMRLRILTIDPNSDFLSLIDKTEGKTDGSTRADIISLIEWMSQLKEKHPENVQLRTYDHYPYDFYFNMDGTVFAGPYQNKTSQQTITYQFSANKLGSENYSRYFEALWRDAHDGI